ncbi:Hypothetical predicted protein [Pelobates cultripes]|uniref:Uncharacterized protein n=1 Tax=Pelobates cultripes TaxID=61616 RepID=A0AAD1TIA4_PELCU|nr:Hypothetical predicted protein [Pelobates cultripes]
MVNELRIPEAHWWTTMVQNGTAAAGSPCRYTGQMYDFVATPSKLRDPQLEDKMMPTSPDGESVGETKAEGDSTGELTLI